MTRVLLILLFVCGFAPHADAQSKLGLAYYDLDRLYDTLPALFYNDSDYTPQGRLRWNTEHYHRKIRNTAAVIDSMALPVVGLWGVENEAVVRDIVTACCGDYVYLHRTLNTFNGMDFALLYYGDRFDPHYTEEGRGYLYVEGEARGIGTIGIVLCSNPQTAAWLIGDLRAERPQAKLVVMGYTGLRFDTRDLQNATSRAEAAGRGTVRRRAGWQMHDRIWIDTTLNMLGGDVYARRYLVDPASGDPIATYTGRIYKGGYSRSLPVYVYIW